MIIYPISWDKASGKPTQYASGKVFTTVNGVRVAVSPMGYVGQSRSAVIGQAVGNAFVKQWRAQLATKFRVRALN